MLYMYSSIRRCLISSLPLLLVAACGDATRLTPVSYGALDGWERDEHAVAYKLFTDSCAVNAMRSNAYTSREEGAVGVRLNWSHACELAEENPQPDNQTARKFFEEHFTPYKVETEAKPKGMFTGYYEPVLSGSRTRRAPYTTPVYGVPSDLTADAPYCTREEIEAGALKGKEHVLLYVDDPIMLFFLHIQGSGKVRLPDGSLIGLQYAAQNGHPFVPIGRILKERGELPEPSMQGIRDWLRDHPDERASLMNLNPSYVFFNLSSGKEMAKGALGIALTPLHSLAVDDDRAAYGVPTYIDTYISEYPTGAQVPLQKLFVSQDTGGALHGPHRGDIFFGRGWHEEWQAGHQNAAGNVYWLLPVDPGVRLRDGLPLTAEELAAEELAAPASEPDFPEYDIMPEVTVPAP